MRAVCPACEEKRGLEKHVVGWQGVTHSGAVLGEGKQENDNGKASTGNYLGRVVAVMEKLTSYEP